MNDNTIKKRWLTAAIVATIWGTISLTAFLLLSFDMPFAIGSIITYGSLALLYECAILFLSFYCGYLKQGTKLLGWQVYAGSIVYTSRLIKDLGESIPAIKLLYKVDKLRASMIVLWILIDISIFIYYIYRANQLYKMNWRLKEEKEGTSV